jgi:hypothetical protein
MTTRLNKALREEILKNIIKATDLATRKKSILDRTNEVARQLVMRSQPEGFYEVTANLPSEWFCSTSQLRFDDSCNPKKVLEHGSWSSAYIYFPDPVRVVANGGTPHDDKVMTEAFALLAKEAAQYVADEAAARSEARAFLASCKTVEQILERMPELEPHIPKISRPLPLVAPSNLLSTLSALGFDRTASKAQAA